MYGVDPDSVVSTEQVMPDPTPQTLAEQMMKGCQHTGCIPFERASDFVCKRCLVDVLRAFGEQRYQEGVRDGRAGR